MNYRSSSPGDGTNCASSAPPSPVSQSLSPASSPGLAASPASPFTDQLSGVNCQNQVSKYSKFSDWACLLKCHFLFIDEYQFKQQSEPDIILSQSSQRSQPVWAVQHGKRYRWNSILLHDFLSLFSTNISVHTFVNGAWVWWVSV